ncbi:MHYT domain-containing protein [Nocardia sp. NPDC057440]|uniref:MHYT domain-containing protein n=1 Tax=Nocardia sp. NPDC057440 TaxID=3346134 RepID=UPI00366DA62E
MHEVRLFSLGNNGAVDQFSMGYWIAALSLGISVVGAVVGVACILHGSRSIRFRLVWLASAAVSVGGVGIWLATSVVLLGVHVPGSDVRFDAGSLITSMVVAFAAVFAALVIIGRTLHLPRLIAGGVVMGLGTGLSLYLGIGSIQVQGSVEISPALAAVSMTVAIITATATLWSVQAFQFPMARAATTVLFGIGVAGMYYAGIGAIELTIDPTAKAPTGLPLFDFVFPMFVIGSLALTVPITAVLVAPDRRDTAAIAENTRRVRLEAAR